MLLMIESDLDGIFGGVKIRLDLESAAGLTRVEILDSVVTANWVENAQVAITTANAAAEQEQKKDRRVVGGRVKGGERVEGVGSG